jgi:quercetin dioxygenase-like cupin family protein
VEVASTREPRVFELPPEVSASLAHGSERRLDRWRLDDETLRALLAGVGRALARSGLDTAVTQHRLAFAGDDELVYPKSSREALELAGINTAIVQRLERADRVFQEIVRGLSAETGRRVSVSAYVADVGARAFSWHVDKWDTLVVQLRGRKLFEFDGTIPFALAPGDAFFLPEDVRHRTRTLERSIHLSIAVLTAAHNAP